MAKTWKEMVSEARKGMRFLQPSELKAKIDRGEPLLLIDIREKDEFDQGHLPGSYHVPRGILEMTMESKLSDHSREIVLYGSGGGRSVMSARVLKEMGYENVSSMEGGYEAWRMAGLQTERLIDEGR